ncbi:MAG: hypothetical protein IH600_15190 [Bacteroidetes bacterium]|nr:hypothetical protein [Bacteroidota bacterium]
MKRVCTMRIAFTCLLILGMVPAVSAQKTLAERKDTVIAFFRSADVGVNYAAATSRVLASDTREDGLAMLEMLTSSVSPDVIERYRMTTAYVRLFELLPDSMRQRIEYIWGHFPVRPFDGEHEEVVYYASLYLMTRFSNNDAAFFNGKSRNENEQDARAYLLHWMQETTERGQREFDSPTYASVMIASMVMLRDFAPDDDMRRRSEIMAQWLLADYAHDYLNGSYCGAHAREHLMSAMNPAASDMSSVGWVYFGDGPKTYGREQLFLSLSDFEPHPAIVELALTRSEAYESWERKRTAPMYRSGATKGSNASEDVIRYTYMDPLYGIGSIPGGMAQPREQHSWDVTWISENPQHPATLFVMQPYSDPGALTPFMPHSGELALRTVGMLDPYFNTVTKTVGGSPFEDVFQYKNTIIALYDIGEVSRFPVIAGFFPPEVKSLDIDSLRSRWIMINTGDVYLAVYPLAAYRLVDGTFGKHFFSSAKRNGVIVQAVGRNIAGAYDDFKKKVRAMKVDTSRFADQRSIAFTTLQGDKLEFTFGGARSINGKTIGMKDGMLFDSPLLESKTGTGVLTIKSKKGNVIIDMRAREIRAE